MERTIGASLAKIEQVEEESQRRIKGREIRRLGRRKGERVRKMR